MPELPLNSVILGDCIDVMNSLPAKSVNLIFADPPYNLQLNRELWRPNNTKVDAVDDGWDKFASVEEYDCFTRAWLTAAKRLLAENGTIWVIGTYHNIYRVGAILMDLGYWILNDIVWIKANPTPHMNGVRFCNAHETLLWARPTVSSETRYTFNYKAMKAGNEDKQMRSDWYFPVCQGDERLTVDGEKAHTTQKPEALLHRVITSTSKPGDVILDPFCGTGTTATVAKRLGRNFITIDREPAYIDVARARIEAVQPLEAPEDESFLIGGPKQKIPFVSLVESGKIPAGTRLRLGKSDVYAVVHPDGTVAANGRRGSIHQVSSELLGPPKRNGWEVWHYVDPETGIEHPITNLRPAGTAS
jgi:modification methylase